jgi:hypothetical protein
MRRWCTAILVVGCLFAVSRPADASGHGPVFGAATPTLGKGGWQLDQAWLARAVDGYRADEQMLRTMISTGITEDLQISVSLPIRLQSNIYMPRGRMMTGMSSDLDIEGLVAWRFQRRTLGAGSRFESTLTAGAAAPLEQFSPDGMRAAPSAHISAATGFVSRSHYWWIGGGYHWHGERSLDRMGNMTFVSAVYGYRPPFLQGDYPKPDLRFFVEALAEDVKHGRHHGFEVLSSGGRSAFVGPSALLLYKAFGAEAGILFPVYQGNDYVLPERFRFALNVTYFFWRKGPTP